MMPALGATRGGLRESELRRSLMVYRYTVGLDGVGLAGRNPDRTLLNRRHPTGWTLPITFLAKVRVAGSNLVVRSKNALVSGLSGPLTALRLPIMPIMPISMLVKRCAHQEDG